MFTKRTIAVAIVLCFCVAGIAAIAQQKPVDAEGHAWWQHAVFYEVYPRSFADSNNDGIGDLNGIASKLDYLRDLGVDAIWITPCFPSPQVDFGYDVSDYEAIDPMYGTMKDFDHLVAEAKKRNIRVLLDFVVNHSSDKHKWFEDSKSSKTRRAPRLVHLARWQGTGPAAEQLAFDIWIVGVEAGSEDESVLLPLFLSGAAGLELAEPSGRESDAGCDAVLVQARRRGVPAGCGGHAV